AVLMGYGCGFVIGLSIIYKMPSTQYPAWFSRKDVELEHKIIKRMKRHKKRNYYSVIQVHCIAGMRIKALTFIVAPEDSTISTTLPVSPSTPSADGFAPDVGDKILWISTVVTLTRLGSRHQFLHLINHKHVIAAFDVKYENFEIITLCNASPWTMSEELQFDRGKEEISGHTLCEMIKWILRLVDFRADYKKRTGETYHRRSLDME
ncbi:hypothetical protein H5410_000544, partial [Solanum commersonii]